MLMTQEELADLVGVSEVAVRRWGIRLGPATPAPSPPTHARGLDATPAEQGFATDELTTRAL
jgi:hypothetical protein